DARGNMLEGAPGCRPSAETAVHLAIVSALGRAAGAVLHTHSVWGTIVSERHAAAGTLELAGYELLAGLEGVSDRGHRERLPIVANSGDWAARREELEAMLRGDPGLHGF